MATVLDTRAYGLADQEAFGALSGDVNPIHVDPLAARRELFGDVVVHGLHLLLRALEASATRRPAEIPHRIRASFPHPVFVDEPLTTTLLDDEGDGWARLVTECGGARCVQAATTWRVADDGPSGAVPAPGPTGSPRVRTIEEIAWCRGQLGLTLDAPAARARFPALAARLGSARLAALVGISRLVGMECPGLRSVLSGLDLVLDTAPAPDPDPALAFTVERVVRGASFVRLAVAGGGVHGTVDAFVRPPPVRQPSFDAVRADVGRDELAGQEALVIGGGRGLGEVTAKLVAAGGGRVILTYGRGRADAERVVAEIRAGGGRAAALACDVARPADLAAALASRRARPTHLYYFASPPIFVKRGGLWDDALYARFASVYVDGLAAVIGACRDAGATQLRVFYPSSTALDAPVRNLEEYAAAKAAGEARCAELGRAAGLDVVVRRLPRIATDQTLSVMRVPAASALDVMRDVVREMAGSHV